MALQSAYAAIAKGTRCLGASGPRYLGSCRPAFLVGFTYVIYGEARIRMHKANALKCNELKPTLRLVVLQA